jgi:hypothetical protein
MEGFDFTNAQRIRKVSIQSVSCLYRKDKLPEKEILLSYKELADQHILYYLNRAGRGYYMNERMATYRVHSKGLWSSKSISEQMKTVVDWTGEIYEHEKNEDTIYMLRRNLYLLLAYYLIKIKWIRFCRSLYTLACKYGCKNCLYLLWYKIKNGTSELSVKSSDMPEKNASVSPAIKNML